MTDRWARDTEIAVGSLKRLRRAGVYWATADGLWDINKAISDGHSIAWVVDAEVNASYARKISAKAIVARRTRAYAGYNNGRVMWGYRRSTSQTPPLDAPASWRSPRQPAEPHPENFSRLQQIGEWAAAGASDTAIALRARANGWILVHPHRGVREWSKSFIAELVTNPFPRESAPGSGHGTIVAPDGERIEGQHEAAWSWDLWHRMDAQREMNRKGKRGHPTTPGRLRLFSGLASCIACDRALHFQARPRVLHGQHIGIYGVYLCASADSGLICPAAGHYKGIREDLLAEQFASLVLDSPLPPDWRTLIMEELAREKEEVNGDEITARREQLEAERRRVLLQHRYGRIEDDEMLRETARLDEAIATLPSPSQLEVEEYGRLEAAEAFTRHRDYWERASEAQRSEMLRLLLQPHGLAVHILAQRIERVRPQPGLLPIFRLALPSWYQVGEGWLARERSLEPAFDLPDLALG